MKPLLVLFALLAAIVPAQAHTITFSDGETFTFDQFCCNSMDCEQVPLSAIKEVKGGYDVDYMSHLNKRTRHINGFVAHGDKAIRFNPFADRVMACSSGAPGKVPGSYSPRCIYPRQNSM